jgi:hypothetical protein
VFNANIVRIPEARIKPLCIVASTSEGPRFWGYLPELVEGILEAKGAVQESRMADIAGKRSRSVNLDLGLQILDGFLRGFGLPSTGIAAKFAGAKTVSFSFQEVVRFFISPAALGKLLGGHALDAGNTANDLFFRNEAVLLVIDSVITSRDFSIQVGEARNTGFKLDVPAIQEMVGNAKAGVQVETTTGLDVTFKGDVPLTFAFTCLRCPLDPAGRLSLAPHTGPLNFEMIHAEREANRGAASPGHAPELLYDGPVMIEWQ